MPVELNNDGQNWLIWAYFQDMKRIVELGRVYNILADGLIVVITAQFSACIGDDMAVEWERFWQLSRVTQKNCFLQL